MESFSKSSASARQNGSLVIVHKGHSIARPCFDKCTVQNFPQIVLRALFARLVEIVMQRNIKESSLFPI